MAFLVRIAFALLTRDTYDYDEFVLLLLGRDYAHGATPYTDFMFFHPPGALALLRALQPILAWWWPAGRALSAVADTATAWLVWLVARRVLDEKTALAAGCLYAFSPLALISATRVGQDPLITLLGMAGLALVVLLQGWAPAFAAGLLLGLALWIKYPALYFLPVYLLAAPRRFPLVLFGCACSLGGLLLPFHDQLSALYMQTVTFQRTRWVMEPTTRLGTVALYWLLFNGLTLIGLWKQKSPTWLVAGYALGVLFLFPSQVYYHYFVVVVPFACMLGAGPAVTVVRRARRWTALVAIGLVLLWAAIINWGGPSPLYVTAAHLSAIRPTIQLLDARTTASQPVLADRYEYAYLARRPSLDHYFWNIGVLVNARYLERRVDGAGAVVLSYGASSGFPRGFTAFLDWHYRRIRTAATSVWLTGRPK